MPGMLGTTKSAQGITQVSVGKGERLTLGGVSIFCNGSCRTIGATIDGVGDNHGVIAWTARHKLSATGNTRASPLERDTTYVARCNQRNFRDSTGDFTPLGGRARYYHICDHSGAGRVGATVVLVGYRYGINPCASHCCANYTRPVPGKACRSSIGSCHQFSGGV